MPIPGFDGKYLASSRGRIKSVFAITKTGKRSLTGTILKTSVNERGYLILKLSKRVDSMPVQKTYKVHRLIAATFHENPHNKPQVNHKDLNKLNNSSGNLEWATAKENTNHAQENGALPLRQPYDDIGEYPSRHKKIKNIHTGEIFNSAKELATITGLSVKSIRRQLSGERKCNIPYAYIEGEYCFEYKK